MNLAKLFLIACTSFMTLSQNCFNSNLSPYIFVGHQDNSIFYDVDYTSLNQILACGKTQSSDVHFGQDSDQQPLAVLLDDGDPFSIIFEKVMESVGNLFEACSSSPNGQLLVLKTNRNSSRIFILAANTFELVNGFSIDIRNRFGIGYNSQNFKLKPGNLHISNS